MTATFAYADKAAASRTGRVPLRVSVVVPTYLRPMWLVGCLTSLLHQTCTPDEVIAVMRADDVATHDAFDQFVHANQGGNIDFRKAIVTEPGFLPPIAAGIAAASGDVVAFIDDDAEALPDWLERLMALYTDPTVTGAGGRYVNMENGIEVQYPRAERVGRFRSWGSFEGNMYRELRSNAPCDVDFFMGGNMSYRRDALLRVELDRELGHDVAFHYEVDLGQQIKRDGGRLLYDPLARVRHYSAPRADAGMRKPSAESVFWYSHNSLYIAMKHSRGMKRWVAVAYSFVIGSSRAWGVGSAIASALRHRTLQPLREMRPAFAGKGRAIRIVRMSGKANAQ